MAEEKENENRNNRDASTRNAAAHLCGDWSSHLLLLLGQRDRGGAGDERDERDEQEGEAGHGSFFEERAGREKRMGNG